MDKTLHKARLMGFIAGDGNLDIRREKARPWVTHHDIRFYPDDDKMLSCFKESFKTVYGKEISYVKEHEKYKTARVCSKFACLDLTSITKFGTKTWKIPLSFLKTKRMKKEWLRAFFDCEAYVGKGRICVQSVNKQGILQIKNLLESFNIRSRVYEYERKQKNWSTNHLLFILDKKSRHTFLKEIGFNHQSKQKKLEEQFKPR